MTEQLHEMLAFVLKNDAGLTPGRARSLASHFSDINDFMEVSKEELLNIRGIKGKRTLNLTGEQADEILRVRETGYIDPGVGVSQNFLAAISRAFTKRQLNMIRSLSLENLNPNPFLIKTLNLHTPLEVVRVNVYMAATRSIVTSMGFFVERLLLSSSDDLEKGPTGSGWDIIKTDRKSKKHWIQVKSGPNDMDKDQIVYWTQKIQEKIDQGDSAYIGITYGKRTNETVTFGIMKQLLPDWKMRTLIGRELWDFINDDPEYHTKLFDTLRRAAQQILQKNSICDEIEACVGRITGEFIDKYGDGSDGVSGYIKEIF